MKFKVVNSVFNVEEWKKIEDCIKWIIVLLKIVFKRKEKLNLIF